MFRKETRRKKIRARIRSRVAGTAQKPRLSVFRSNKYIYAQLIDDLTGKTLVATSSRSISDKATNVEVSALVGKALAEKASTAGISEVVFDRGGYLYHGRVKALADGAREGGLKF
ncbi:MAG: 50S ribosomal protein L18 [Bacteroidia bacterium]|nr:50S ribosomal protein L18 [Bacteroidia bacterium]